MYLIYHVTQAAVTPPRGWAPISRILRLKRVGHAPGSCHSYVVYMGLMSPNANVSFRIYHLELHGVLEVPLRDFVLLQHHADTLCTTGRGARRPFDRRGRHTETRNTVLRVTPERDLCASVFVCVCVLVFVCVFV